MADFAGTARFEIVRRLGEGGMGVVYEAIDRDTGARVAIKTLHASTTDGMRRLKREFRSLQGLAHPNLVRLGELIEAEGTLFFTMELVHGDEFLEYTRASDDDGEAGGTRPFDEERLRHALIELAKGLAFLHGTGRVHRDVKPSNVLVTAEGRSVLLDFGLVSDEDNAGWSEDRVIGTAAYMAPEQAAAQPVGPEADWYAYGVLLYEALVGVPPFTGTYYQVLLSKQQRDPTPPAALRPDVPAYLDALCVRLLSRDPASRPNAGAILKALGAGEQRLNPSHSTVAHALPFVGRVEEQGQLWAALAASRAGAVTLLVQGESGVGKTALARRFADEARTNDAALVFHGRCYEREDVPYKALDGVVDALARWLQKQPAPTVAGFLPRRGNLLLQVFPPLRGVESLARLPRQEVADPFELRTLVFTALRDLFARIAREHILVVAIDDIQWADADSLALLGELVRAPDAPALLLVCTGRPGPGSSAFLQGVPSARALELGRLPPRDAQELVRTLLQREGRRSMHTAADIASEAEGHPMYIDELCRFLAEHTAEDVRHGRARLDDALWQRIAALDAGSRRMLEVIAIARGPLKQSTCAQAAGLSVGDFMNRASELRASNLIRTSGARTEDSIEAYHDRVRESLLARVDDEARRALHLGLARVLEMTGADAESLAEHYLAAGERQLAAQHALLAARRADELLAFDRAARLYRRVLELDRPADKDAVRVALAQALANAGRGPESAAAYLAAMEGRKQADALELQYRAAEQLLRSGRLTEGTTVVNELVERAGMRMHATPRRALASLLFHRAVVRLRGHSYVERDSTTVSAQELGRVDLCWSIAGALAMVDNILGASFQARHVRLALEAGDPYRVSRALATEAVYFAALGDPEASQRILADALAIAARIQNPHALGLCGMADAIRSHLVGEWRVCVERSTAAETTLRERCTGTMWERGTILMLALEALVYLGELREFRDQHRAGLAAADERGDQFGGTNLRTGLVNVSWLLADDADRARRESTEAVARWPAGRYHLQHFYHMYAMAQVALYEGNGDEACAQVEAHWKRVRGSLLLRIQHSRIAALHLRGRGALLAAHTSRDGRLRDAERDAKRLTRERTRWGTALARLLSAGVANRRGDAAGAARLLAEAVVELETLDMWLHATAARHHLARLVGGNAGDTITGHVDDWLARQGGVVRNPPRLFAMLVPGFA